MLNVRLYLSLLLLFVSFAGLRAQNETTPATMKAFKFYDLNGKPFTNAQLKANTATIVIYFSPDCDHCQKQSSWIQQGMDKFPSNVQFLYITDSDDAAAITAFKQKYFGKATMPVFFVQDKDYKIDNYFGYSEVPSIYIYSTKNALVKSLKKETSVAELLTYIK